jgi:hypothetical protein
LGTTAVMQAVGVDALRVRVAGLEALISRAQAS